jgi:hypothetical protein
MGAFEDSKNAPTADFCNQEKEGVTLQDHRLSVMAGQHQRANGKDCRTPSQQTIPLPPEHFEITYVINPRMERSFETSTMPWRTLDGMVCETRLNRESGVRDAANRENSASPFARDRNPEYPPYVDTYAATGKCCREIQSAIRKISGENLRGVPIGNFWNYGKCQGVRSRIAREPLAIRRAWNV